MKASRRLSRRSRPTCRRPAAVEVVALLPYERGDLLSRVHDQGEVISLEHTGDGTMLKARVGEALAGELAAYPG